MSTADPDRELLESVILMRRYQKAYFNERTASNLRVAKDAERRVDDQLRRMPHPDEQSCLAFGPPMVKVPVELTPDVAAHLVNFCRALRNERECEEISLVDLLTEMANDIDTAMTQFDAWQHAVYAPIFGPAIIRAAVQTDVPKRPA